MMNRFSFRVDRPDLAGAVIHVAGEVDSHTVVNVEHAVMDEIGSRVLAWCEFDLADVTFIDSSGIRMLIVLRRELTERGAIMTVVTNPTVDHVLELSGLNGYFDPGPVHP